MQHDLVCPNCKAGLVVDVTQARGGEVGEFAKIVAHASQEEMQAALDTVRAAHETRQEAADAARESEEQIAKGRVAHRLAGIAVERS